MVVECKTAINNEIVKKESSKFGFKDIFKIAVAAVKIYAAFYTGTNKGFFTVDVCVCVCD